LHAAAILKSNREMNYFKYSFNELFC
jgi:hypothetical protein